MIETKCDKKECAKNDNGICTKKYIPMIVDNTKTVNTTVDGLATSEVQGKCIYPEIDHAM